MGGTCLIAPISSRRGHPIEPVRNTVRGSYPPLGTALEYAFGIGPQVCQSICLDTHMLFLWPISSNSGCFNGNHQ